MVPGSPARARSRGATLLRGEPPGAAARGRRSRPVGPVGEPRRAPHGRRVDRRRRPGGGRGRLGPGGLRPPGHVDTGLVGRVPGLRPRACRRARPGPVSTTIWASPSSSWPATTRAPSPARTGAASRRGRPGTGTDSSAGSRPAARPGRPARRVRGLGPPRSSLARDEFEAARARRRRPHPSRRVLPGEPHAPPQPGTHPRRRGSCSTASAPRRRARCVAPRPPAARRRPRRDRVRVARALPPLARPRRRDAPGQGNRTRTRARPVASEKDRAENVMIVDLARNDLGRVCEPGSIAVPELCAPEHHPGLVHLVSSVRGTVRTDVGAADLLRATFPAASITGAPKPWVLQAIEDLEPVRRGVYCGAIGWLDTRRGGADLSVAIRTFTVARRCHLLRRRRGDRRRLRPGRRVARDRAQGVAAARDRGADLPERLRSGRHR